MAQGGTKRLKGIVFSLPAMGLNETISLFCNSLAEQYDLVFYNWKSFSNFLSPSIIVKNYPVYEYGYKPGCVNSATTYFQFADILADTSISLLEFLKEEVDIEKPDFIVHSHLAIWGKLLSIHFSIPAVCLFTTFVFDKKTMLPAYKMFYSKNETQTKLAEQLRVLKKYKFLFSSLDISIKFDIWDTLANKEELNLIFIHEKLQPSRATFSNQFKFVGYPIKKIKDQKHEELIYLACGSVFNIDPSFFTVCIDCLEKINSKSIVALGKDALISSYPNRSNYIKLVAIADQKNILKQAKIFISLGGIASIHEAIQTLTPMIVIPMIAEQHITGRIIQKLGIGRVLPYGLLSTETLTSVIQEVNDNYKFYELNIKLIRDEFLSLKTIKNAKTIFIDHINKVFQNF